MDSTPKKSAPERAFLTVPEAAAYIGSSARFLETRIEVGEIKVFRPSRRFVRISKAELERWIEEFSHKGKP